MAGSGDIFAPEQGCVFSFLHMEISRDGVATMGDDTDPAPPSCEAVSVDVAEFTDPCNQLLRLDGKNEKTAKICGFLVFYSFLLLLFRRYNS